MSPDARLIASALLFAATIEDSEYTVERIASHVEAMENALATQFPDSDRGIRGMVPVGWVNQMLDELFSVAAQVTPQPVPVADKIISIRTQLKQFQGDV